MALAKTQAFEDIWSRRDAKRARIQVRYKRRFFDAGSATFKLEDDFKVLDQTRFADAKGFASVGEIVNNLDIPFQNVFTQGTVTLRLNNTRNEWLPSINSPSIFAADDVAPLGYDPVKTLFEIRFGYILPDETIEFKTRFTGLATDYQFEGKGAVVEVTVSSKAILLQNAEASRVRDDISQEATVPAAADGVITDFITPTLGIGRVDEVRVAGVVQTPGVDYEISDLDDPGIGAKISFRDAPVSGAVDWSGFEWKKDQLIETLIGLLADEGTITSSQRSIEQVIFPFSVAASRTIDSQTEWAAGILISNIDVVGTPGSALILEQIVDDFSDNDFTSNPVWTVINTGGSLSAASGALVLSNVAGDGQGVPLISTPLTHLVGSWRFDARTTDTFFVLNSAGFIYFMMNTDADDGFGNVTGSGYAINIGSDRIRLSRITGGVATHIITHLGVYNVLREILVTRDASGNWELFSDVGSGLVSRGTVTDNTHTTAVKFMVQHTGGTGQNTTVDNIKIKVYAGDYESAVFDLVQAPLSFQTLDHTDSLNGGTLVYKTAVADESFPGSGVPGAFDAFVVIGGADEILSAIKRFFKIRIEFIQPFGQLLGPQVDKVVANFTQNFVAVSLAIFTGETCFQAVERLVRTFGGEFLFKPDGTMVTRLRVTGGSPVLTLDQNTTIISIDDYRPGYAEVITVAQVKQGGLISEFDAAAAGESEPTSESRFGRILSFVDLSTTLLQNDAQIGLAAAQNDYNNRNLPKRRARIRTKIIPWLEIGDIVRLNYFDHPLFEQTIFGDPLQIYGDDTGAHGEAQNVLARNLDVKIIGLTDIPDEVTMEMTVEEILS